MLRRHQTSVHGGGEIDTCSVRYAPAKSDDARSGSSVHFCTEYSATSSVQPSDKRWSGRNSALILVEVNALVEGRIQWRSFLFLKRLDLVR